jgi:hypothetical protein
MSRKSDKWRFATDIFDPSIKIYRSHTLDPVIDLPRFLQSLLDRKDVTFSTKDIAQDCELMCLKRGKPAFDHDAVKHKLLRLEEDGIVMMNDPGFKKDKSFTVADLGKLEALLLETK